MRIFLTFLCAATQTIKGIRRPSLARKSEDNPDIFIVYPLRSVTHLPPRGREDFYEIDPDKDAWSVPHLSPRGREDFYEIDLHKDACLMYQI